MSTLETQYKNFLKDNPNSNLPFEEWKKVNARLIKQAIINMTKKDEELGLYDELFKHKVETIPASAVVNGNEVRLVTRDSRYFIHWGEEGRVKAEQELTTPSGRKPCQATAHKKFLEAVEATQYLKFSKL